MAEPILNLILRDLADAVAGISAAADHDETMTAETREEPYNPATDMKAVVYLDEEADPIIVSVENNGDDQFLQWQQPIVIVVTVVNPEVADAPNPDERIVRSWSSVVKAVMLDRRRGGYAIDTDLRSPKWGSAGVICRFAIDYIVRADDPTRQS